MKTPAFKTEVVHVNLTLQDIDAILMAIDGLTLTMKGTEPLHAELVRVAQKLDEAVNL
jgi:hypothetical protein